MKNKEQVHGGIMRGHLIAEYPVWEVKKDDGERIKALMLSRVLNVRPEIGDRVEAMMISGVWKITDILD